MVANSSSTTPLDVSKFTLNRPPSPMLSRDADSVYWMSRYVERAEHVARILLVNGNLLTDVGDLQRNLQHRLWQSVLTTFRLTDLPAGDGTVGERVVRHMTFDPDNVNSLLACISRARENARGIRETISAEMWENLNTLYWSICGDDAAARFDESHDEFYRTVMIGSMLFQGLTDQTLAHDQRWMFTQLGKYLERIDVTCRVIEAKYNILKSAERSLEAPLRNIHWMAVLRSCCSIEAYRRHHIGDLDPLLVSSFLILERHFPRSVRFSVRMAHAAIAAVRAEINPTAVDAAERILGRLATQLEYAEISEILSQGLPEYLQAIQATAADAALAIQKAYFLH